VLAAATASGATYNAVKRFSYKKNPNKTWSYLVSGTPLSTSLKNGCEINKCDGWWNGGTEPVCATILGNKTSGNFTCTKNTVRIPAATLNLDPETYANVEVRWTAPMAGTYTVTGSYRGDDTHGYEHAVLVEHNGTSVYSSTITSYEQLESFDLTVSVNAEDTLGFVVDTNPSSEGHWLSTGQQATIKRTRA
jgi:hypothetical protein